MMRHRECSAKALQARIGKGGCDDHREGSARALPTRIVRCDGDVVITTTQPWLCRREGKVDGDRSPRGLSQGLANTEASENREW